MEIFEGCTLSDGSTLHIIQASWLECAVTNYLGDSGKQKGEEGEERRKTGKEGQGGDGDE